MVDFLKACEKARKVLINDGYRDGFDGILDADDEWIFFGRYLEDGEVEYGNAVVKVNKNNGNINRDSAFSIFTSKFEKEPIGIEIPEKYKLKKLEKIG